MKGQLNSSHDAEAYEPNSLAIVIKYIYNIISLGNMYVCQYSGTHRLVDQLSLKIIRPNHLKQFDIHFGSFPPKERTLKSRDLGLKFLPSSSKYKYRLWGR